MLHAYKDKEFDSTDTRAFFIEKAKHIHDQSRLITLTIPSISTQRLMYIVGYGIINQQIFDLAEEMDKDLSFSKEEIIISLAFIEKTTWDDLENRTLDADSGIWRSLTLREHVAFDYFFPKPYRHAQVLSFGTELLGAISDTDIKLGIRSFVNQKGKGQLDTCFLKDETFENAFVPLTQVNP